MRRYAPPVPDKIAYLTDLVRGRRVLDVGCVSHFADAANDPRWLHKHLRSAAAECLGLDILADDVAALRARGVNAVVCDFTRETPGGRYEVVVIGDVIEHVDRPGDLLRNARDSLSEGGRVVVMSPNPYYLHRAWRFLTGKFADSVDHVIFLYPAGLAEMAERNGLRLDRYRGVKVESGRTTTGRAVFAARRFLTGRRGLAPESFCETLIYEFVRA